ncbi:hypothetical protein FHW69_001064 [Luteibacter sp. Sphag1AF]|uniref:sugar dehydrogenase complex small subunit n=1 Tax=Luteibacter sp. Sphag1AF TaxID=2587031 RepID=UPI0016197551|nr:sugar dehydrogenase complex small subunit [Luteibacter sp. Sphag1AF]MBB3226474.1 hypothetical protein [Luteibacter sp. Sphag1AF]
MHVPPAPSPADAPSSPSRRRLIVSASLVAAGAALLPWSRMAYAQSPAQASPAELAGFLALSCLLTSRPHLDAALSQRVFVALADGDRNFGFKVRSLADALGRAGITDMKAFKDSAVDKDPDSKALVVLIVSAWYHGYTGTPKSLTSVDDTRFITYTEALMFAPTRDVTVIPTYARAGTDYWAHPPASIATD